MNIRRTREERPLELNITALTDVVLLIIIFFMFSTHFARAQQREMDLPREPGAETAESAAAIIIEIEANGTMTLVGGGNVSVEDVVRMVTSTSKVAGRGPITDVELIIRAERDAPAKHLNALAGALAKAGLRTWKLATRGEGN
ncbi:MAG: ExbD/TolR family protein [Phycisphaerales bacterium]